MIAWRVVAEEESLELHLLFSEEKRSEKRIEKRRMRGEERRGQKVAKESGSEGRRGELFKFSKTLAEKSAF